MTSSKCKTSKSKSRKKRTVSTTSAIKWDRHDSSDFGNRIYTFTWFPTDHVKVQVVKQEGYDWYWYVRDMRNSRTLFEARGLPDRKSAQKQALVAYIMYVALKLIARSDKAEELYV